MTLSDIRDAASRQRVACSEPQCTATAAAGTAGWCDFDGDWLCPRCIRVRQAQARRSRSLLAEPLPRVGGIVRARGTRRRIQALARAGWPLTLQAHALGISLQGIQNILTVDELPIQTHRQVEALHARLWNVPPPRDTVAADRSVRAVLQLAADHDWQPSLAWDDFDGDDEPAATTGDGPAPQDEVVIQQAIEGLQPPLTPLERRTVVRYLHGRRWSTQRIAAHIGCTDRTVTRDRRLLGLRRFPQADIIAV